MMHWLWFLAAPPFIFGALIAVRWVALWEWRHRADADWWVVPLTMTALITTWAVSAAGLVAIAFLGFTGGRG